MHPILKGLQPAPDQTISEWSDANRVLSGKGSSEPGPWRTSRTPYLRLPMDCMGPNSPVEMAVLMFGAQTGKTEASLNVLGYMIAVEPGPILYVSPTTETMKRTSRQRIAPAIEDTPALRGLVAPSRSRDEANTVLLKEFPGGALIMTGANSAVGLRSMPARTIFCDELDAFPRDVDGEGAPLELALKRQTTFPDRKTWVASTPTTKDASRIEQLFESSNKCRYFVPCPHCGEFQVLRWAGLKWSGSDTDAVKYACEHCGTLIDERFKTQMLAAGEWRAERPEETRVFGFHLSSLYSPLGWLSWAYLVREFLAANGQAKRGDMSLLRVFINTRLAETFEEGISPGHKLADRADHYPLGSVPDGVLAIMAGVDAQADRLECYLWGFGREDRMWLIDFRQFFGRPEEKLIWAELAAYLDARVEHLPISATGIDSGHHTAAVYDFVGRRRNTFALKGSSTPAQPVIGRPSAVEKSATGRVGARVHLVGTDTAKTLLYGRMGVAQPGPGYVAITDAILDEVPDFFEQLAAERLVTKYRAGAAVKRWEKRPGHRNEALDCMVYALAAFHALNGHRVTPAQWDHIEKQQQRAKKVEEAPKEPELPPIQRQRRRSNWVTGFRGG